MTQVKGITVITSHFTCSDDALVGSIFQDIHHTIGDTRRIRLTIADRLNHTPVLDFAPNFFLNILAKQIYPVGEPCSDFLDLLLNLTIQSPHDTNTCDHEDSYDYDKEYRTISEEDLVMDFVDSKDH